MDRAELIGLVSALLAAATARNDGAIIAVCEELGRRLIAEGEDVVPVENPASTECVACAARRIKKTESQRKWRENKKGDKHVAHRRRKTRVPTRRDSRLRPD